MKILSILVLALVFYFLHTTTSFSQTTNFGFTLSPPFKEITLEKESPSSSYFIEIANNTPAHQTFFLSVVDFGSLDESGGVAFLGEGHEILGKKYGLASWVVLEKDSLEIESRKVQKIEVTILNKESLSPGGHYAAVVSSTKPPKEEGKNVLLNVAFASLIFVKKTGGEIYRLDLAGKEIRSKLFGLPQKIALRFQNSGNVHLVPRGTVTVTDPRGIIISKGIINPESGIILPESFRLYHVQMDQFAFPMVPGYHAVNIQYRHEGREEFIKDSFTFFYPGFVGIAAIGAVLFIIFLTIVKKRAIRDKKHTGEEREK